MKIIVSLHIHRMVSNRNELETILTEPIDEDVCTTILDVGLLVVRLCCDTVVAAKTKSWITLPSEEKYSTKKISFRSWFVESSNSILWWWWASVKVSTRWTTSSQHSTTDCYRSSTKFSWKPVNSSTRSCETSRGIDFSLDITSSWREQKPWHAMDERDYKIRNRN